MTQFYETSAFKNGKLSAERMASYQCVLRFPFRLSKVLRLPRKSEARSREVLHLSRKMIFPKLKIWCSKMQPLSGNHRPGLLTCLGDVSCTALSTRNLSLQVLFKRPSPAVVFETAAKPTRLAHPWQGAESIAPATNNDASTSKSAANPKCFEHLDFQMCFTPQDTRASTFSRAPAPKVLQCWGVFAILTSKFASHHNHVQFLISHPAKWLRTRRCSEPTFRPSGGIRRPRQTQGGARQGIILLTRVSDYYHFCSSCSSSIILLTRVSDYYHFCSSCSSSSNQQQLEWMVCSHLAAVFWTEGAGAAGRKRS